MTTPNATSAQEKSVQRTPCNVNVALDGSKSTGLRPSPARLYSFPPPGTVLPATPPLSIRRNRCPNKIALDSNRSRNELLSDLFIYALSVNIYA